MKKVLIMFAALAFAAVAQAQNYKWVDKDGKVRYGDTPPPGVKATPLKGPAAPPPPPPAAAKDAKGAPDAKDGKDAKAAAKPAGPMSAKDQEADFRKRQAEQKKAAEKAAKAEQEAAVKRQNCEVARSRLRDLEGGVRIAQTNEKGERVFMDDDQRAREIAASRKSVAEWCN